MVRSPGVEGNASLTRGSMRNVSYCLFGRSHVFVAVVALVAAVLLSSKVLNARKPHHLGNGNMERSPGLGNWCWSAAF